MARDSDRFSRRRVVRLGAAGLSVGLSVGLAGCGGPEGEGEGEEGGGGGEEGGEEDGGSGEEEEDIRARRFSE